MLKSLAHITSSEGDYLYLQGQLTVNPDGNYTLKYAANNFWLEHIVPAINSGTLDPYMANSWLFSIGEHEKSKADQLTEAAASGNNEVISHLEWQFGNMVWRFTH